ncbi:hypothetical protein ACFLRA_02835 [Bdellovibrionota bacterium]
MNTFRNLRKTNTFFLFSLMCAALFFSTNSLADNYVNLNPNDIFSEIYTDGRETGVKIRVEFIDGLETTQPSVTIPEGDNLADCTLVSITKIGSKLLFGYADPILEYSYEITVNTSVVADSGYCLIWIKAPDMKTISIVKYVYQTGY